jgi:hypothetical protein
LLVSAGVLRSGSLGQLTFFCRTNKIAALAYSPPAFAQNSVPLGYISKLGVDVDIRSGATILADDLASGNSRPRPAIAPATQ